MTVEYNLTSSANSFKLKLGGNKLHISYSEMNNIIRPDVIWLYIFIIKSYTQYRIMKNTGDTQK